MLMNFNGIFMDFNGILMDRWIVEKISTGNHGF